MQQNNFVNPLTCLGRRVGYTLGMSSEEFTAVFYHLPKTAGTSINRVIQQNYAARQIVQATGDQHAFVAQLKGWPDEKKREVRLLQGHFGFGVHQHLPQRAKLFTLLRDPVERTLSYFNHARTHSNHYLYELIHTNNWSLVDLLQSGEALMLNNGQTRLLSGVWGDMAFGEVDDAVGETAVSHLNQFAVVGLTEQFDATLLLLRHNFNWHHLFYTRANVGQNRPKQAQLDAETLALIKKANQQDLRLYSHATQLLEQQKHKIPHFWLRLKWFQFRLKRYQQRNS